MQRLAIASRPSQSTCTLYWGPLADALGVTPIVQTFCISAARHFCTFLRLQLDQRDDGNAIQDELAKKTGGRSVPRVFINQKVCAAYMNPARPCLLQH